MKTNNIKLTTLVLCLFVTIAGYSQTTYLKITKSKKAYDYVMYPPGTKFELKNEHGYILFKNSDEPGFIKIEEPYTLYVYPYWKDEADVFKLTEGKVEKILTSSYKADTYKKYSINNHGVTAKYTVTDSEDIKGEKNLEFKLSNGITFEYNDSKYRAYINKEENYLNIEGKYLVESDLGTLKLSFNPKNGQVWWVFESSKK